MDSGLYAASAAYVSRTQVLDTIANNLANANTTGFRAEHTVFSSVLASAAGSPGTNLNRAINSYGVLGGASLDMTQGALQKTGNDLDLAVQGSGFFVVQTADGEKYTRNGGFQVSSQGELVTAAGDSVEGQRGAIHLPPGKVVISSDGTISSNGAVAGKIKLVKFDPSVNLTAVGNTNYTAPDGAADDDTESSIQQGALESSNVNPVSTMVELIDAQRSAEMMQRALTMFSSEMDKTATQDLPKVS
jgi:flagellar basal-body rod protein FlgF/flagellar basal-body rod protein FlgG